MNWLSVILQFDPGLKHTYAATTQWYTSGMWAIFQREGCEYQQYKIKAIYTHLRKT